MQITQHAVGVHRFALNHAKKSLNAIQTIEADKTTFSIHQELTGYYTRAKLSRDYSMLLLADVVTSLRLIDGIETPDARHMYAGTFQYGVAELLASEDKPLEADLDSLKQSLLLLESDVKETLKQTEATLNQLNDATAKAIETAFLFGKLSPAEAAQSGFMTDLLANTFPSTGVSTDTPKLMATKSSSFGWRHLDAMCRTSAAKWLHDARAKHVRQIEDEKIIQEEYQSHEIRQKRQARINKVKSALQGVK